jgi:hypothetical protein
LVKTADPTITTEIVGMRVVPLVGVGMFTRRVRFRIADPEVMAVVEHVAVILIRRVVVMVGALKIAERAECRILGVRMITVVPNGTVRSRSSRSIREYRETKGTERRLVARVTIGSDPGRGSFGRRHGGIAT